MLTGIDNTLKPQSVQRTIAERLCRRTELQNALNDIHKDVYRRVCKRPQRSINAHYAATKIVTPNFDVGDFVLICKETLPAQKISLSWCEPRRVFTVKSRAICVLEDLVTQKRDIVHVACIKNYCGKLDGTNIPEAVLDLVDNIFDIAKNDEGIWLRLQWVG